MSNDYYQSRFVYEPGREAVWKEIAGYLQRFIPENAIVVDLGAGYCDFINQIKARERYAVDVNLSLKKYVRKGVTPMAGKAEEMLRQFQDKSVTTVFSSNFLEHLEWSEIKSVASQVKRIMVNKGRWILIQPNFKYAGREYFDDYTHRTVFTETSLSDYLKSEGFFTELKIARFLPLSFHSRLPKSSLLVKIYLRLPVRPLAKQMLIIARKEEDVAE